MRPLSRLAALSALLLNACYPPGDGKAPPLDEIYFPTGVALDGSWKLDANDNTTKSQYLYVANSDFDLQYRSSSVISYDLDLLSKVIPQSCNTTADCRDDKVCDAPGTAGLPAERNPTYYCVNKEFDSAGKLKVCGALGERDEADLVLYPGRCNWIDPVNPQDGSTSLKVGSVGIGAFAADVVWRGNCAIKSTEGNCEDPSRLFIPVRGDSTLHWVDVRPKVDGQPGVELYCGHNDDGEDGCDDQHRAGDNPEGQVGIPTQPSEPFAIDATADGQYVVVTNQTSGTVSLYVNDWRPGFGPELKALAGGLPIAPVGVAAIPEPRFADTSVPSTYEPAFLVTYRNAAQVDLLRVHADEPYDPMRPDADLVRRYVLQRAGSVPVNANSLNFDQRGIAIDDSQRLADYKTCDEQAAQCTSANCADEYKYCLRTVRQPAVFAASRAPASMLVGALNTDLNYASGTSELPGFMDSLPLSFGPSRVITGMVRVQGTKYHDDGDYDLESRVFIVCFDSRRIFVYDPKKHLIEAIVSTGRGPHALAVDGERGLAYLAHFTDSYLGVISLDQRFPQTYAAIIASIGAPKAPRSSK
ncbi:MAG TPA: hypothetical protein VER96_16170 [Polyangiaceae bacterium]|nr:hypothetical protein [Polyangiaceae bacterium]